MHCPSCSGRVVDGNAQLGRVIDCPGVPYQGGPEIDTGGWLEMKTRPEPRADVGAVPVGLMLHVEAARKAEREAIAKAIETGSDLYVLEDLPGEIRRGDFAPHPARGGEE